MSTSRTSRPQLHALTGLRFFAAMHVVVFHVLAWSSWSVAPLHDLAATGYVAVSLFFVLSGMILAYTYGRSDGPIARRAFYAARFARIYPVYALGLVLAAPFVLFAHASAPPPHGLAVQAIAVATLVQAHVPSLALAWNPPGWSLSAEAFFYLLFPLLAPPILRMSAARARLLAAGAWLVLMGAAIAYLAISPDGIASPAHDSSGAWLDFLRYGPVARLPEFVIGVAMGRELVATGAPLVSNRAAPIAAFASAALVIATLALSSRLPYLLLHDGLLAPAFVMLLLSLARGKGVLARALSSKPVVLLGEASYSLYILHVPLLMIARSLTKKVAPAFVDGALFHAVYLAGAIVASLIAYRLVELPLRDRLRAILAPRVAPAIAAAAEARPSSDRTRAA